LSYPDSLEINGLHLSLKVGGCRNNTTYLTKDDYEKVTHWYRAHYSEPVSYNEKTASWEWNHEFGTSIYVVKVLTEEVIENNIELTDLENVSEYKTCIFESSTTLKNSNFVKINWFRIILIGIVSSITMFLMFKFFPMLTLILIHIMTILFVIFIVWLVVDHFNK